MFALLSVYDGRKAPSLFFNHNLQQVLFLKANTNKNIRNINRLKYVYAFKYNKC